MILKADCSRQSAFFNGVVQLRKRKQVEGQMAALTITTTRQYLDWPLGQTINQNDLKQQLGVHATDSDGTDLTNKVLANLTQVNINQQGEYPVLFNVMNATGQTAQTSITLNVRPMRTQATAPQQPQATPRKKNRGWLWTLLVIVVLLCLVWVLVNHRNQQAQQAANNNQQSSQIANNSNNINKLSNNDRKLANQVAELKGATKQYEKDKNQQALNQRLDQIENKNQQLANQTQSSTTQNQLNQVTNTIEQVRQDPSNGTQIVNELRHQDGFKEIWVNISSMVQNWMAKFAE